MFEISIIALAISALALPFTVWAARATARQARAAIEQTQIQIEQVAAAREQTHLQQQLARDAAQPYVWADIQPDTQQGTVLHLVVGNSGPTMATNVRVVVEPSLPRSADETDRISEVESVLAAGLHSLAPGRELRWTLGAGFELMEGEDEQRRMIRVEADGPSGPIPPTEIVVDIKQWRWARDAPDGSLHLVRGAIQELSKGVVKLDGTISRVSSNG